MLKKPQSKEKVQENPAVKVVPEEAAGVQAEKALVVLERVKAEKVKALEKVEKVMLETETETEMDKAKVEIHPRIQAVLRICPEMEMEMHLLMN